MPVGDHRVGRTIVLTGASDGIGAAAAQVLADAGHSLVLVGRSPEKTEAVARRVGAERWYLADFTRLDDVRRLAADLTDACPRIDVLANNAGGVFSGPVRTVDGFERTFQVNHLAPFLLTRLLMDTLLASRAAVVATSSVGARLFGHVDLDDLETWDAFTPNRAYGTSKLANILVTRELHERYHDQGLTSVAFHPGAVATNFASDTTSSLRWVYRTVLRVALVPPARGGATLAHFVAGEPGRDWTSGEFYGSNRRLSRTNPQASDPELVHEHWRRSAELLGLPA